MRKVFLGIAAVALVLVGPVFAGFGSTETFLPAVGRVAGQGGAQFYTTVWASNLTTAPQTLAFQFLKQGQANPSPESFEDTLQPGETKVYENVVESKLGLTNAVGAARVTSSGELFVSERIYNQPPGNDGGNTEGLFFAGVPKSFSISAGQSASIQGVDQGGSENFRYNFALIETGGGSPDVNVQVFDGSGTMLGQKSYPLSPYEQIQPNVADVVPGIHATNARITATVTGGGGSVLLAGAQLANESQDSSGFEMTFRDELLGGGSSGGLTSVIHDSTLTGDGSSGSPLGVSPGSVVTSLNGLHGAVTLSAGSNVTITPSGSTLTIASSGGGGGGGLTLPFSGSTNDTTTSFAVGNTGGGEAIQGSASGATAYAIKGLSTGDKGTGVFGTTNGQTGATGWAGVWGDSYTSTGVFGTSITSIGVQGKAGRASGNTFTHDNVIGVLGDADGIGVLGTSTSTVGVRGNAAGSSGESPSVPVGVWGDSGNTGIFGTGPYVGVSGFSSGGVGVRATSQSGTGILAQSTYGYSIICNGSGYYTGTWTLSSDARFKKNVMPLPGALESTLSLRGVTFDWRRDEFPERHFRTGRDIGVIAQEVETVYPELVVTDRDGYKSVDYARLTPILVEAIKAQQGEIEALTRRLDRLERDRGFEVSPEASKR